MDLDAHRCLTPLEIPAHSINDHRLRFAKGISLGGDPSASWIVNTRPEAPTFRVALHVEGNLFMHGATMGLSGRFRKRSAAKMNGASPSPHQLLRRPDLRGQLRLLFPQGPEVAFNRKSPPTWIPCQKSSDWPKKPPKRIDMAGVMARFPNTIPRVGSIPLSGISPDSQPTKRADDRRGWGCRIKGVRSTNGPSARPHRGRLQGHSRHLLTNHRRAELRALDRRFLES